MAKLSRLAILFIFLFGACEKTDLNDTDENGTATLYFRASLDGVSWNAASPTQTGASLDNNVMPAVIKIHANGPANEYFYLRFPPMAATDTSMNSSGVANRMEYHKNSQKWLSKTGSLNVHQAGSPSHREYSGTFSGTFVNTVNNDTIIVTSGEYLTQGVF